MLKLLKNCSVYAPKYAGKKDILIMGERIHAVADDLSAWQAAPEIEVYDINGAAVCPGIVDTHVHITGGGGEQGPVSRTPEIRLSELTLNGVTTVVSPLGTDGISRSLENLLFKCRALEHYGLTCRIVTGNYRYPSPTLTGDVARDIALIGEMIGVKIAISDHRGSNVTWQELARLGTEVRVSSMLSGKKGYVIIHVGSGKDRLKPLFDAVENSELPADTFLPTHCCRTAALISDAVKFNKMGGTADFTADTVESENGTAAAVYSALQQGADPARITMSSDACGSQPKFDANGSCIGITYTTPETLLCELRRLKEIYGVPFETALAFFTENPARVAGFAGKKGVIRAGADADIMVLGGDYRVDRLFARGTLFVDGGAAVVKDYFEK